MLVLRISGFHIGMLVSHWYCDSKKNKIDQENIIFTNLDASEAQQDQKTPLIPQPFIVPYLIAIINQSTAARHSKFGKIWGKHLLIQNEEPKDSDNSKDSNKNNILQLKIQQLPSI
ncbi:38532_t:CDS:2 [Gigaspora margarita]|uniref:38532_t:CDS:1 n=1 Tax=Gigaspora margarita TaxID=4874 RepID=A0ABN7W2I8_GIGMA|nr:38532_t:CDS:2 [Gigaspora margarita]